MSQDISSGRYSRQVIILTPCIHVEYFTFRKFIILNTDSDPRSNCRVHADFFDYSYEEASNASPRNHIKPYAPFEAHTVTSPRFLGMIKVCFQILLNWKYWADDIPYGSHHAPHFQCGGKSHGPIRTVAVCMNICEITASLFRQCLTDVDTCYRSFTFLETH